MTNVYTKEQIDLIGAKIGQELKTVNNGLGRVKDTNTGDLLKFWVGTQEEYESVVTKDPNTLYMVKE